MLFFASGACGLVYQQLWLRELSLVVGVTVQAASTVLAAFFGGLALGSALAGRLVERMRRPLLGYGAVELAVGLSALVTPAALDGVTRLYVGVADGVSNSTPVLTLVRFVLSFAVLLVPATLMGATLPLVVQSSTLRSGRIGERVSLLYATNTAGAIVGTVAAGFWLIGSRGLAFSFRGAAAINVAVGMAAVVASRRYETETASRRPAAHSMAESPTGKATTLQRVVLVTFAVSGFVAIALEVVWFRVLVLYLESDTYAFTVMLATVLMGLALGGYAAAAVLRVRQELGSVLLASELAVSLAALTSFALLSSTYGVAGRAGDVLGVGVTDLQLTLVASGLAILPTSLAMGFAFPIGLRIWAGDRHTGQRVGTFYATNVAAGIVGSVAAGFVLVPHVGVRPSVVLLASLVLAGAVALAMALPRRPAPRLIATGGGALFVVATVVAVPDPYAAALRNRFPGHQVLWRGEGAQTTVSIHQQPEGFRAMYLDGLHQANDGAAMVSYHSRIGTLPLALHPDARSALVVGLGGGVTAGALAVDADLAIDIIELSPEVVTGARYLAAVNGDVTNRPNVDIRVDDGRNHLLVTDQRYDIVTADLIQPEHAGAGKLWSKEYWELARDALAPGGIMVQWVPTTRQRDWSMIVRSYLEVFPYVTAWSDGSMLVGSNEPLRLDSVAIERSAADPVVGPALAATGLAGVDALMGSYTAGRDELVAFIGPGPVLTDDRPALEYYRSSGKHAIDPPDLTALRGDGTPLLLG